MRSQQTPDEEKQLEQLILRLLTSPYDQRNQKPHIFFGKLPENFPLDVPLPEKSRVLGTLARSEAHIEILLDSDLTRDEIQIFYRTQLARRDWIEPGDNFLRSHMGGFASSQFFNPNNHLTFCQGEQGPTLHLITLQSEKATTDIRLNISLDSESNPYAQEKRMKRHMPPGWQEIIPTLTAPKDAEQRMMNGSGGGDYTERNAGATLRSELALDILAKHYGEQLSKAGWLQSDAGENGLLAWHTWTFMTEDQEAWKGLFFILKRPDEEQDHMLFVRAELERRPTSKNPFSGWMGASTETISTTFNTLTNARHPD
jgi:hypothetical protein